MPSLDGAFRLSIAQAGRFATARSNAFAPGFRPPAARDERPFAPPRAGSTLPRPSIV